MTAEVSARRTPTGPVRRMRALSPTERKYLIDAARGLTAAQSATVHQVSVHTVNSSLRVSKAALRARSIAHAVSLCLRFGEFSVSDIFEGK